MKSTLIKIGIICLLGIGFSFCSNSESTASKETAATAEIEQIKEEVEKLDSLSSDLETIKNEIENNVEALESALEEL